MARRVTGSEVFNYLFAAQAIGLGYLFLDVSTVGMALFVASAAVAAPPSRAQLERATDRELTGGAAALLAVAGYTIAWLVVVVAVLAG